MFGGLAESPDFLAASQGKVNGKVARSLLIHGRRNLGWSSTSLPGDVANYLDTSQAQVTPVVLGTTYYLRSSSANDAAGGTGARTIRVVYLDSAGALRNMDVATNGTTAVNLGAGIAFVQWATVLTAGSLGVAAGNITISSVTGAPTVAQTVEYIQAGETKSRSGRFKIPTGHTGYLHSWDAAATGGANQDMSVEATVQEDDRTVATDVFLPQGGAFLANNVSQVDLQLHWRSIPAGAVVKITSIPSSAPAGNRADGALFFLLVTD